MKLRSKQNKNTLFLFLGKHIPGKLEWIFLSLVDFQLH